MLSSSQLDAIIIADSGVDSLSGTNPLKLKLDGRVGDIQVVKNFVGNNGRIVPPVRGDDELSWASAPKLNGIYLASYLTNRDFNIALIQNYAAEKNLFSALLSRNPRVVIISTPFIFFKQTLRELAADIRSVAPDIRLIAGGSFINYSYLLLERAREQNYETRAAENDFLFLKIDNEPDIDLYIISPRGENILCEALERVKNSQSLEGIANTAFPDGNEYIFGPRQDDTAQIPQPEVDWNRLPDSIFRSGVVPMQASNGCPFNCAFCNFTKDRRFTFIKPLDRLVDELKAVAKRGTKYVWFVDDNFRLGKGDLMSVCRRFIQEGIEVRWMCFIRASALQNADLALLRQAGCIELQIGLESGDTAVLNNMNKKADPAMYKEVIRNLLYHGINVSCYFITGFPGETESTAKRTREFIRSIECPDAEGSLSWSFYPFLLSPLSPVYEPEMRKKFGLSGYMKGWSHATMDYPGAKKLVVQAFLELENSGPIYRGDNLDMLNILQPANRKEFHRTRHRLSKRSMRSPVAGEEIIRAFADIFS